MGGNLDMGNPVSFDQVFHAYYPALCFYAQRLIHDTSQAEDIVEEPEDSWAVNQVKLTWMESSKQARAELGINHTRLPQKGTEYYARTRAIFNESRFS